MKKLYLTTAIALLASPALADITPEELWESWQKISGLGVPISAGQQARQGNVLVLQDVKTEIDIGFLTYTQTVAEMRLEALPDGTVSVSYDSDYTGNASFSIAGGFTQDITLTGQFERSQGLAVGTADDYVYDFDIGLMHQIGEANMEVTGQANTSMASIMDMKDVSGQMHVVQADTGLNLTYTFSMGEFTNTQNALTPAENGHDEIKQVQHMQSLSFTGEVEAFLPLDGSPDGLTINAALALQSSSMSQKVTSPRLNMDMELEQGPGTFTFLIDDQKLSLMINRQSGRFSIESSQFGPQPYSAEIAETQFDLTLPLHPSDTPQDASFALSLEGLTVNDAVWAIADPANTLSHAPADFVIDARASIDLLLDWTDFEAAKNLNSAPAILHSIKLQDFLIAFENARLTGVGVVEFSNDGPVPEPNGGMINFTLDGVNALLDKLGTLPLVDPSLTAGAKGMLGMFTASSGGPDSLKSVIEFSEGGHVSINGQQVR